MVRFVNRRLGKRCRLTVRRLRSRNGYRLVVAYPDGLRRLYAFPDESALIAGTSALQAELASAGWEPLRPPAPRVATGRLPVDIPARAAPICDG